MLAVLEGTESTANCNLHARYLLLQVCEGGLLIALLCGLSNVSAHSDLSKCYCGFYYRTSCAFIYQNAG